METLGIDPQLQDPDRHDYGYVPVPPVISAQITIIAETLFFRPLQTQIIKRLDRLIGTRNLGAWFTTYLVCVILLHNCALITGYNFRKAKNLRLSVRGEYRSKMLRREITDTIDSKDMPLRTS